MTLAWWGPARRSVAADSAEALLLRVLGYAAAFAASVVISRGLGPEGRGLYYLPVVAAGTAVAICSLGMEQAIVYLRATKHVDVARIWAQGGLIAAVAGAGGALSLVLAPAVLPGVFAGSAAWLLLIAGLTVPLTLHVRFAAVLLTLEGQVAHQFRAALLAGAVQVALLAGLLLTPWFGVASVLGVHLITVAVTWLLTVMPLRHRGMAWVRWEPILLRDTLRHALVLHAGMILFFLHLRLDMFMVKTMVGTAALGQYSISVVLAETVLVATDALALAILPRQVGNTLAEAGALALRGVRTSALLGLGMAAVWAVAGMGLIRVAFGRAFAPAYLPLVALLPGMVFLGMQRVCGAPLLRVGQPARITGIYASSLVCNVALNWWWIPAFGIVGAALASSLSYALSAVLFVAWTSRVAGVPWVAGALPRRSEAAALWRVAADGLRRLRRAGSATRDSAARHP